MTRQPEVLPTRHECLDAAAQVLVDAIAEVDAMTPEEAAAAAGCRTEAETAAFVARLTAERTERRQLRSSA